ncbi:glycosyltransferase [Brachybacterium sp. J144]|uniref:glycosyltransferase family 2 protein n=1 Tax=Brachybacterium sp. J144 TaxID=3116487 RepID=UPI002E76D5FF|nr:glycosyltransferase [Brachybacterium sp. J144]MEE1650727.1 glycosyltransferase [Brachybacterium sp. J144]
MSEENVTMAPTDFVSVIIGFKDWGLERLELSVRSIHDSLSGIDHEVIISDYGSEDADSIAASAERVGARHEIVETNGEWSRSRALNAGVRASRGEIILATDADMLFTPRSLSRVVEQIQQQPQEIVILQCRDLPIGYSHEVVSREGFDWERFASIGQIRPRWGMGGLVAITRENWERLRGWDERMHTYGGEDVDLGKRAQAFGSRINWLDEPGMGMFHIWHPSSGASAARSKEATAAIAENRRIHSTDATFARNRVQPRYLPKGMVPLVTVLVDTVFHGVTTLSETLTSVLGQSVQDIEIIVPDDVDVPADPRILRRPANDVSPRGTFTTSVRAGEIWAEDRLENLLALWAPGVGLISDRTAHLLRDEEGEALAPLNILPAGMPSPRTTVVRSALLPSPVSTSSEKWSGVIRSVASSGAHWVLPASSRHVTVADLITDEAIASERAFDELTLRTAFERCGLTPPEMPEVKVSALGVLANAILFGRALTLEIEAPGTVDVTSIDELVADDPRWSRRSVRTSEGSILERELVWTGSDATYAADVTRRLHGTGALLRSRYAREDDLAPEDDNNAATSLVRTVEKTYGMPGKDGAWLVVSADGETSKELHRALSSAPSVTVVLRRVLEVDGAESSWLLGRFRNGNPAEALSLAASLPHATSVSVIELPLRTAGNEATR